MLSQAEINRYSRQMVLPEIGTEGQLKLKAAKVLLIGAGGLGCPILQYLAAAGVGHIGIADHDQVEASNLQRQILYNATDIGKYKATVAKEKAGLINPYIQVKAHEMYVTRENVLSLVEPYDIVVDGSDNFATRYLLNDACVIMSKPLVFGSIHRFEGQVSVFNYLDGPTYRCIFPEPPGPDEMPNCGVTGVVASLPGMIGTWQANEVIKIITGIGNVLAGRLLVMDVLTMQIQCFEFNTIAGNKSITELGNYTQYCDPDIVTVDYETLLALMPAGNIQLIDVREPDEHAAFNIGGVNIPLSDLENAPVQWQADGKIIVYCASGKRSQKAVEVLTSLGIKNVMSLQDGINRLQPV